MDRNSVKWWGPIPAIVTPFDDRGAIDEKLLASNIDILMSKGATGIVIGGCTGEFWAMSMEERIALFKLAWDVTGESFAQRMAQYVRFYSGDPIRLTAGFYTQYDKAQLFELVDRALGRRDGRPLAVSPDNPGALIPYQPDVRGMAGTYAATSLPETRGDRK